MLNKRPETRVLKKFNITSHAFITETSLARVWKVTLEDGSQAALKIYHTGKMGNETHGFDFLEHLQGHGAALVFQRTKSAALTEWLDGEHLSRIFFLAPR